MSIDALRLPGVAHDSSATERHCVRIVDISVSDTTCDWSTTNANDATVLDIAAITWAASHSGTALLSGDFPVAG